MQNWLEDIAQVACNGKKKKKSQVTQESTVPNLMFLFEVGNIRSFQKLVFGG